MSTTPADSGYDELKKRLDAIHEEQASRAKEVFEDKFSGLLIHGGPVSKKFRRALEKAEDLIEETTGSRPKGRAFNFMSPTHYAHYLDPVSKEWTHIYLGKWMSDDEPAV